MKKLAWILFFLIMAVSCLDEPDCFRQDVNLVGISFKKLLDGRPDTVLIDSIRSDFEGTISSSSPSQLSLPLNYLKQGTTYIIHTNEKTTLTKDGVGKTYIIKLGHQSKIQFISEDCGERYVVSNLQLLDGTSSSKDSIALVSGSITNPSSNNIIIYRCPRTNIMRFSFRQLYMDTDDRGKLESRILETININNAAIPFRVDTVNAVSSVLLPLDLNAKSILYTLKFADDTTKRTVSLEYDPKDTLIIPRCDNQIVIRNIKAINPSIDPNFILKIANNAVHDPPFTNIEAYRCPTTNKIRILFKQKPGSSQITDTLKLLKLTADLDSVQIDRTRPITSVELPLNADAASTQFTFTIKDKKNGSIRNIVLQIAYDREVKTFHTECGAQTFFTNLIINPDFNPSATIEYVDKFVKFPIVNNIILENTQL